MGLDLIKSLALKTVQPNLRLSGWERAEEMK